MFSPDGSPVYPKVSCPLLLVLHQCPHVPPHSMAAASTGRPLPSLAAQHAARSDSLLGADPLVQDGYTVELLPKLAFFTPRQKLGWQRLARQLRGQAQRLAVRAEATMMPFRSS